MARLRIETTALDLPLVLADVFIMAPRHVETAGFRLPLSVAKVVLVVLGIHLGVTDFGVDLPKAPLKLRHTISYSNLNGQKQVHESKARGIANKTMNTRNWSKSWARVEFSRINTGTTGYMFVCTLIFFANLTSGDRPEKMFGLGVEARARFTF